MNRRQRQLSNSNLPASSTTTLLTRQELSRILRRWRDPEFLGQTALAQLTQVEQIRQQRKFAPTVLGSGRAVQQLLLNLINQLRPALGEPDPNHEAWFAYLIVHGQYVEGRSIEVMRAQLGPRELPVRTYHHYRERALEQLLHRFYLLEANAHSLAEVKPASSVTLHSSFIDWGEAPAVTPLVGRTLTLKKLMTWLDDDSVRIVSVLGLGGVGKTALVRQLAHAVQPAYQFIFWRSLYNAPPLIDFLVDALQELIGPNSTPEAFEPASLIHNFLELFQRYRCLVIWDNFESLLQAQENSGKYRPGFEDYGQLLILLAGIGGGSQLLLTSREAPPGWARPSAYLSEARTFRLEGLDTYAGHELLAKAGLQGDDSVWERFITAYSGNPLILKITADVVQELFNGDLARYLKAAVPLLADAHTILHQQFERLNLLSQAILLWLAVAREPVTVVMLLSHAIPGIEERKAYETLYELRRRSLLELSEDAYMLQPVVLEFLTNHIIETLTREICSSQPLWLISHSLLTIEARDYVLQSQRRQLLLPVADNLERYFGSKAEAAQHCLNLLSGNIDAVKRRPSYLAGNLVNLLQALDYPLAGLDLSGQCLWNAHFGTSALWAVNLAESDLSRTKFLDVFDSLASTLWTSNGDRLLAGSVSGDIHLWRASDGKPLQTLRGHSDWVRSLALTVDAARLASASSDHTARIWELPSGQCLHILEHPRRVRSVAFSSDARWLATGSDDGLIRIWAVATGDLVTAMADHTDRVYSVAFSPDGEFLASGSWDCTIRIWHVSNWNCHVILTDHTNWVRSVAFNASSTTLASAAQDGTVRFWDTQTWTCRQVLIGHTQPAHQVVFSSDGQWVASGGEDQTIRIWDAATGVCRHVLLGHKGFVEAVAFSPTGQHLVSVSMDQSLRIWDVDTGQCIRVLSGHSNHLWAIAVNSQHGWLAAGSNDYNLRVWEWPSGKLNKTWMGHTGWVENVLFDPTGRWLASASDDATVVVWDCETWQRRFVFAGHTRWSGAVAFHPTQPLLASGSEDGTIRIWSLDTGVCIKVLEGDYGTTRILSFTGSGQRLYSAGDKGVIFEWNTSDWTLRQVLQAHTSVVWCLAFDANGSQLASAGEDRVIKLWDTQTWHVTRKLNGHQDRVLSLAYQPNGYWLASGSMDRTIRIWDCATGECRFTINCANSIRAIAFDPTGQYLIGADDDSTLEVWETATWHWVRDIRSERLYEGLNITGSQGLSASQRAALLRLGAHDSSH